jgi:N-acetylglucosamine kinase-like BadF-type ATPase
MTPGLLLGVDGGGTKTEFVLIDRAGRLLARHRDAGSYHLQVGIDGLRAVLRRGLDELFDQAHAIAADVEHAFFGLPAYGEDSSLQPVLDALPESLLGHRRYRCGNDMVCTWAGSLAAADGIGIVAGTGAIGYGERAGAVARASGWGELFGDEGSAYWVAIQGLNAFSRMADGRLPKGPLHPLVMREFGLRSELDLCARVMGPQAARDEIASLSGLVANAAEQGDSAARAIFDLAGRELSRVAQALRERLGFESGETVLVSYSGGLFRCGELVLAPLREHLAVLSPDFEVREPLLGPAIGAALYAARDGGGALLETAIDALRRSEAAPCATP